MLEYRIFQTAWGYSAIAATGRGLRGTLLPISSERRLQRHLALTYLEAEPNPRLMPDLVRAIQAYFQGKTTRFDVRLDLDGLGEFRRRVLQACRRIPRGRTASYADLARSAGSPRAARAAGSTMARNPLPLIVPCHRVVRSDGSLGDFSSPEGPRLKRRMLDLEGAL